MIILSGFLIGLVGSLHCIGMCGPIAVALPANSDSKFKVMLDRLLYNFGRVVTYTFLGVVFGLLGNRISLVGLQQTVSIALGLIIILAVLTPASIKSKVIQFPVFSHINNAVKTAFKRLANTKSTATFFNIGIVNGFLPCGFVYVGIAGAITTGTILGSASYMALFGLGTIPIMLATSMFGQVINLNIRRKINKLIPVLAILLAVIFILRGLNLGIPYLSPKLTKAAANTEEVICH